MKRIAEITFFWLALHLPVFAADFNFVQFDVAGAVLTRPLGVNARGQIVGTYRDATGNHGFAMDRDGSYVSIDVPGATFTNATSINGRGDIVGRWTDSAGNIHGYLRTSDGHFSLFDPASPCVVGKAPTVPHGINDLRDMVGRCFDANGKELGWLWRHNGTFEILDELGQRSTDAQGVTNGEVVVGDYADPSGFVHGYLWTSAEGFVTLDVPGNQTGLRAMNERGDVTGVFGTGALGSRNHGFLLRKGVLTTVDYPGSIDNPPQGGTLVINDNGLIVGGYIDVNGREHGFVAIECPDSRCQ